MNIRSDLEVFTNTYVDGWCCSGQWQGDIAGGGGGDAGGGGGGGGRLLVAKDYTATINALILRQHHLQCQVPLLIMFRSYTRVTEKCVQLE